jgi:hypothetical protein
MRPGTSAAASARDRPVSVRTGTPCMNSGGIKPLRAAHTKHTGSSRRRRAANPSAAADSRSTHCKSSTSASTGARSDSAANMEAPPRQQENVPKEPPLAPTREPRTARWPVRRVFHPADREPGRAFAAALHEPAPIRTRNPRTQVTGSLWPYARRRPAALSSRYRAQPSTSVVVAPSRVASSSARTRVPGRDPPSHPQRSGFPPRERLQLGATMQGRQVVRGRSRCGHWAIDQPGRRVPRP